MEAEEEAAAVGSRAEGGRSGGGGREDGLSFGVVLARMETEEEEASADETATVAMVAGSRADGGRSGGVGGRVRDASWWLVRIEAKEEAAGSRQRQRRWLQRRGWAGEVAGPSLAMKRMGVATKL
uniref:DUF834 domain-containing protein n=1 Tax=Oryza meridionalis TaxID=40149 RepID=A0A0E0D116_9ORYZ